MSGDRIIDRVRRRMLELIILVPGIGREVALRRAAHEVAAVERIKLAALPEQATPKPVADDDEPNKRKLFQAIDAMRLRRAQSGGHSTPLQSPPMQSGAPGQPLASPGATDAPKRGLLKRYRLRRDDEPSQPTPARSMQEVGLLMGILLGGGSRVQLIPDSEYPVRFHDTHVTKNWRASIEANERRRNQPPMYDDDLDATNLDAVMAAYDKQKRERDAR